MEEGVFALLQAEGQRRIPGIISSVYNNTVNLQLENGVSLVVASGNAMLAPQMIQIGRNINFRESSLQLKPGKPICIMGKKLFFNEFAFCSLTGAKILSLRIPELKFHKPDQLCHEVKKLLLQLGKPGGFRNPWLKLQGEANESLTLLEKAMFTALVHFAGRTYGEEERLFFAETRQLVGLGTGLTPSGDDFLTGFFAVMTAFDPQFRSWCKANKEDWLKLIHKRTTAVSYEMLKYVLNGKVNMAALDLLLVFTRWKTPQDLVKPVQNLLELGSSSGTDMLTGMQFGLDYIHVWKGETTP